MGGTLIDWERIICGSEDSNKTAVLITPQTIPNCCYDTSTNYFEQYGTVELIREGKINGNSYLVIQFKDGTSAANLIRKCSIVVQGTAFSVIPFGSNDEFKETIRHLTFTYPPYYAPPAPDRSEDNILNVLNDDCLDEIFRRMGGLPQRNRIRIGKVCTRFKRVADTTFASVFRKQEMYFGRLNPKENSTLQEIETFLHRFGPLIVRVSLLDSEYTHLSDGLNSVLKLLSQHCPNIKRLGLHFLLTNGKEIENQTLFEIRPLLSKLSNFSISHDLLSVCNAFITACDGVEKLSVSLFETDSTLPEIHFSKLKSCHFSRVNNDVVEGFLALNPQIEELEMRYEPSAVRLVPDKIPNVRKLTLKYISKRLTDLDGLRLKSLNQAMISMHWMKSETSLHDSIENICKIKNIANLHLMYSAFVDFNVIIELTKCLCNLETLKIDNLSTDDQILPIDQLKKMLQHAKKLTQLWMYSMVHEFCEKDYNELLQIVKNRSNHPLKLNIELRNTIDLIRKCERKIIFSNTDPRWLTITNCYNY